MVYDARFEVDDENDLIAPSDGVVEWPWPGDYDVATKYQTVLLFGAPGAGKGTQGKILGQIPGFYHLSCGEVFRTLDINSELGKTFRQFSSRGELVPDEVTVEMWAHNIHAQTTLSIYKPHDDLLILDGIPRNVNQAELMDDYIDVLEVIHLVCKDQTKMIERLQRRAVKENRADDAKKEVILRRWEIYKQETQPVLDFYPADIIREVDAVGSPASVLEHVLEALVPVQEEHFSNPIDGSPTG